MDRLARIAAHLAPPSRDAQVMRFTKRLQRFFEHVIQSGTPFCLG